MYLREEKGWRNPGCRSSNTSAFRRPPWCSAACPLGLRKTEITYLGSVFTLELPSCPSCGLTLVPEELALGKMHEVEQILEDK